MCTRQIGTGLLILGLSEVFGDGAAKRTHQSSIAIMWDEGAGGGERGLLMCLRLGATAVVELPFHLLGYSNVAQTPGLPNPPKSSRRKDGGGHRLTATGPKHDSHRADSLYGTLFPDGGRRP